MGHSDLREDSMLSVLELAKKLKGNCCEKLVKYTGQEYVISGANVGLGSFKLDIGSFQNKIKEINAVPPIMMAMDNNQYLLCQQASELKDNPELKDLCLRIRLMHIMAFTQLQALLSIPTPSEELGKQILGWTIQMNKLTAQSIDLLSPQPKATIAPKNAPKRGGGRNPEIKSAPRMSKWTPKVELPVLSEVMKYQGIDEAQMQTALKTLKE
jgi:hypothetical protein